MLNILLVDDEYVIRTGVSTVINRSGYDWNVAGMAANGLEALECMNNYSVDLVITDIRMSDMDGIQLMEEIVKRNCDCEIIVMTAFPEFEFAKKALEFGATDYLLKPVDPENLIEVIKKAEKIIHGKLKKQIEYIRFKEDESLLRRVILRQVIMGHYKAESNIIKELEWAGCRVSEGVIVVAGFLSPVPEEKLVYTGDSLLEAFACRSFLAQDLSVEEKLLVFMVWKEEGSVGPEPVTEIIEEVSKSLNNIQLFCGISEIFRNLGEIESAFRQSINSFYYGLKTEKRITSYHDIKGFHDTIQYPYDLEYKLIYAIKSGNSDDIESLISELTEVLFEYNKSSFLYDLALVATNTIKAFKRLLLEVSNEKTPMEISSLNVPTQFIEFVDQNKAKEWFRGELSRISNLIVKNRSNKCRKIIEQVKAIAISRYNTDITIKMIADEVYMNASYLSDLFKQSTGKTFTEFLSDYRCQKAKEFLKDPNIKVYEAAEKVGYKNTRYFSQIFKKTVGVLPNEFKEIQ